MRSARGRRANARINVSGSLRASKPETDNTYGRWSPGSKLAGYRRRFDAVIDELIAEARADSALADRGDMLALLLQAG